MASIVNFISDTSNHTLVLICLFLAALRVYLEIIKFDFIKLPISKLLSDKTSTQQIKNFHRYGLYFSLGYIILFAPTILFS
ncbi:MAG: hypothetical protein HOJ35_10195 [Bdellovibrionales bacterium]|jgi:hypothetical protein|nr:hypothetical protein [Bdellovibrionales bacterium]